MTKIGRNELCPCGSGKKYKKCCGANLIKDYNIDTVNNELYKVHGELISFTMNQYDDVIDEQVKLYEHEPEMEDIYKTGLTPWMVTKSSMLENNKTIFQAYIDKKRSHLSLPARQTMLQWMEREPSVYEVLSIDEPRKGFAQIKNIAGKKETHLIPYDDSGNFPESGLIIGLVVPFFGHDNFLFTMIRLFNDHKVHFQKLLLKHRDYPALLKEVLEDGVFNNEWLQPEHEEVADLFATYATELEHENNIIAEGILLWSDYCQKINPSIQKPEPNAAAFTYFYEKDILHNESVRQVEIAEAFNTSASSLSSIYRRIANEFESNKF